MEQNIPTKSWPFHCNSRLHTSQLWRRSTCLRQGKHVCGVIKPFTGSARIAPFKRHHWHM